MKKYVALPAAALLALSGASYGQGLTNASLELRIRAIDVTSASPLNLANQGDNIHTAVASTDTGSARTRRFEVQYRVIDPDFAGFNGLSSFQFNITATTAGPGSLNSILLDRALNTRFQQQSNSAILPPGATDVSGNPVGPANIGARGLHRPLRGGIAGALLGPDGVAGTADDIAISPNNSNAPNGVPGVGTPVVHAGSDGIAGTADDVVLGSNPVLGNTSLNQITPLALSALGYGYTFDPATNEQWYGLYNFEITVGDSFGGDTLVNVSAQVITDPVTNNKWAGYIEGNPVPLTSRNATDASAAFRVEAIPAPGSLALVGLGGLIAARRRRA